jgi:hypothetical protein
MIFHSKIKTIFSFYKIKLSANIANYSFAFLVAKDGQQNLNLKTVALVVEEIKINLI